MEVFNRFILITLFLVGVCSGSAPPLNPTNVSIIVLGRSGTGISTSVAQLLNPATIEEDSTPSNGLMTRLKIYDIPIPGSPGAYINLVDADSLVDGKTVQSDAEILAVLKSYIQSQHYKVPNVLVGVSSFDDTVFEGNRSNLLELVKRMELLETELYSGSTGKNNLFLFSNLMSVSRELQKDPSSRLELISKSIRKYSKFDKSSFKMVVGENSGRKQANGYLKLSNKEEYPRNVFDKMVEICTEQGDTVGAAAIGKFRDADKTTPVTVVSRLYAYTPTGLEVTRLKAKIENFDLDEVNPTEKLVSVLESLVRSLEGCNCLDGDKIANILKGI